MKKVLLITFGSVLVIVLGLVAFILYSLTPVSKSNENVNFVVNKGDSKVDIAANLKSANLVRNKYVTLFYIMISKTSNLQAGTYSFTRDLSTKEIVSKLSNGEVIKDVKPTVSITFKEGLTMRDYAKLISDNLDIDSNEFLEKLSDLEFLDELIKDYNFLTDDVKNNEIYYSLEGYLYPETYNFFKDSNSEDVIRKILDYTSKKYEEIKEEVGKSNYSIHEILTIASIVEKEAKDSDGRKNLAQVIYNRMNMNMNLGMDVTSYYGVKKDYRDKDGNFVYLTNKDLSDNNPYNTRLESLKGLPVGPICNPSLESIKAALNPTDNDYLYVFAEISGELHFTNDYNEFLNFKKVYGW